MLWTWLRYWQWDRPAAQRMGRALEEFGLVWIEEPLDAYDARGMPLSPRRWTRRSLRARCSRASPGTRSCCGTRRWT
nr:enolase C-terminal domain-like protein [Streptomyces sp. TLI_55]